MGYSSTFNNTDRRIDLRDGGLAFIRTRGATPPGLNIDHVVENVHAILEGGQPRHRLDLAGRVPCYSHENGILHFRTYQKGVPGTSIPAFDIMVSRQDLLQLMADPGMAKLCEMVTPQPANPRSENKLPPRTPS